MMKNSPRTSKLENSKSSAIRLMLVSILGMGGLESCAHSKKSTETQAYHLDAPCKETGDIRHEYRCCFPAGSEEICRDVSQAEIPKIRASIKRLPGGSKIIERDTLDLPPEKLWEYISNTINTPDDIPKIIRMYINYEKDRTDRLFDHIQVLGIGSGDCDNMSNVAKEWLLELGERTGHNFQPRIIAYGNHAILIYIDTDGKWKRIDQSAPVEEIEFKSGKINLAAASNGFDPEEEEKFGHERFIYDQKKGGPGAHYDIDLKENSLEHSNSLLNVYLYVPFDPENFKPNDFLPSNWKNYEEVQVHFNMAETLIYKKGELAQIESKKVIDNLKQDNTTQRTYKEGPIEWEIIDKKTNIVIQRSFRAGEVRAELYDPQTGKLTQRNYSGKHIRAEVFDPQTGILAQRYYASGEIEVEFFDSENGELIQQKMRSGEIARIHFKNGEIVQKDFRERKTSRYEIEWYENGKLIQVKTWDGRIVPM